ncbi:CLUMA_CG000054, isoform A [Clunio marinus]|uniref:CLUMA_CG000054, isoform A n=1 Tax=Clunio marinus TaxID=568069 RepID=A0A1J1HEE2_9DIPT|nr:CLUMA_CG000054, isoform A [Clunio marinus]
MNSFRLIYLVVLLTLCQAATAQNKGRRKGCQVGDVFYKHGHDNPCRLCTCFGDEVACAIIDCARPPENCEPIYVEGQCCPEYDCGEGCEVDGILYENGVVIPNDDPCRFCTCEMNQEICAIQDCAAPPERCEQIFVEGQCCPDFDCDIGCEVDGVLYKNGEDIPDNDPCVFCSCFDNNIQCAAIACGFPAENCEPIYIEGQCCPDFKCIEECTVGGVVYQNGDSIPDENPCKNCWCSNGEEHCVFESCEPTPEGCEEVSLEGKCCPAFECPLDCVIKGESFRNGQPIPDNDPCKECFCADGEEICVVYACQGPLSEDCQAVFTEGRCCPEFVCPNTCTIDDVVYQNEQSIPQKDPCTSCFCFDGLVTCSTTACLGPPIQENCELIVDEEKCCPTYACESDCIIGGVLYKDGEDINYDNPCKICKCSQGREICAAIDCPPPPESFCKPIYHEDQCCPDYDCSHGCNYKGEFYPDGFDVPSDDPCEHCECDDDEIVCYYQDCPAPPDYCEGVPIPGQCCRDYSDCGCLFRDVFYESGQAIHSKNPCEFCMCYGNAVECAYMSCVAPPQGCDVRPLPGQCCADISKFSSKNKKRRGCFENGHYYRNGEIIPRDDPCEKCICRRGEIRCKAKTCCKPPPFPGCEGRVIPGQCCPDYTQCELDCSRVLCEGPPYPGCEGVEVPGQCCRDYSNCEVCPEDAIDCRLVKCAGPPRENINCEGIFRPCKCCADFSHCCAAVSCLAPPPGCEPRENPFQCCPDVSHC